MTVTSLPYGPVVHRGRGLDVWLLQAGPPGRVREAGTPWHSMTKAPSGPPRAGAVRAENLVHVMRPGDIR